jgi:hypothetical protein
MSKMKRLYEEVEILYDAGLSDTEIARRLDIPLPAVKAVTDSVELFKYHVDMREGYDRNVLV